MTDLFIMGVSVLDILSLLCLMGAAGIVGYCWSCDNAVFEAHRRRNGS